jgi:hypothetical protein
MMVVDYWVFPFDEVAAFELGAGADECDKVGRVDGAPAGLRGPDELERHGQTGGLGAGAFDDFGAVPDSREGRLDRVRGAQMHPVFGGRACSRSSAFQICARAFFAPGCADCGSAGAVGADVAVHPIDHRRLEFLNDTLEMRNRSRYGFLRAVHTSIPALL